VSTPRDRWYVLAVLTVVYALNIADRFCISMLIEPIRKELQLSDGGLAFLTPQHTRAGAGTMVGDDGAVRNGSELLAAAAGTLRRRHR